MTQPAAAPALAVRPPIDALMRRAIDYAGLFPPASLDMRAAVEEYRYQATGADAWMLGRFVLPAARLDELDAVAGDLTPRDASRSWALTALLGSDLAEDIERIERFNSYHRDVRVGAVHVDTVELKTYSVQDVSHAAELLDRRFDTYMEVPLAEDPATLLDGIALTHAKAKMRTGGLTPDAMPSPEQVLRFLTRCVERNVAFKATAGLHHAWRGLYPLTYAPDAPCGTMFGFLNVILATAAIVGGLDDRGLEMLTETDATSLRVTDAGVEWRGHALTTATLLDARDRLAAFGSCSFAEPVADLRGSHLL
jgi:hypothetical protein